MLGSDRMEYQKMTEKMSQIEVDILLRIFDPYAKLVRFECESEANYIIAYYTSINDKFRIHRVDFLPDDIYVVEDDSENDGEPIKNGDILYRYRQYMVAKGYSEIWLDNAWTD